MYKLTLSADERRAMDWVGYRYFHGDAMQRILWSCEQSPKDAEWDGPNDITFNIPEHIAWQIREGFEAEAFEFSCLATDFVRKLMAFADSIV